MRTFASLVRPSLVMVVLIFLLAVDAADEAVRRCGCVFCVLKSCMDESLREALASELPEEVCDWFRAA